MSFAWPRQNDIGLWHMVSQDNRYLTRTVCIEDLTMEVGIYMGTHYGGETRSVVARICNEGVEIFENAGGPFLNSDALWFDILNGVLT
jgi:hypothetical protein